KIGTYIAASLGDGLARRASETGFSGFCLGRGFAKAPCFGWLDRLGSALQSNRWIELGDSLSVFSAVFCGLRNFGFGKSRKAEGPG
ncbi:MAG: hypothetical protein LKF80_08145, partial [Brevundimonas sp.]|uniref:hypothetical protein n=1 Tax=Brevundimonas sp. TaxID=1871086 RepID=UPI0025C00E4F